MKKRVFWFIFVSTILVLILAVASVSTVMNNVVTGDLADGVKSQAFYLSGSLNEMKANGVEYDSLFDELFAGKTNIKNENRVTLINAGGTVIYDNYADASAMENHLDRPEVAAALSSGSGEATRASDTIGKQTYYYAVKLDDGSILRVASTNTNLLGLLGNASGSLIYTAAFAVAIALILALILSDSIIKPINSLKLSEPLANKTYPELTPLLLNIDRQNKKIKSQIDELTAQRAEFDYITLNMNEGIIIFSADGEVLSENKCARRVFSDNVGASYTTLCRDGGYIQAVESALRGKAADVKIERGGRVYRLTANPVEGCDAKYSAVMFIADVTDTEFSEQMRREFSANVSHELKTPLTTILGCSEIIANGVAKTEDVPRFAEQIHSEADRLLALIEDIIKLSRLDECDLEASFEPVDLEPVCASAVSELRSRADAENVTLTFAGVPAVISGFRPALHEMIWNLIENAVKYNKPGGFVKVSLRMDNSRPVLEVADSGIGIPSEHQMRVFERFYRVDKSHSRSTGGTGLGLSIVKHCARLHKAEVTLDSVEGEGTTVTVRF